MDPAIAEVIGPVLAILGLGSMILIGLKMRYTHLRHTRHPQVEQEAMERLTEDVAGLRDDVRILREEFVDLYERVEFAERVLTRGRADGDVERLPGGRDAGGK
jgi:hypothetical protein